MNKKEFQKNLKATVKLIRKSQRIILACHMNPDGDAIGSMMGLGLGLAKISKKVIFLCPDAIPARYEALPGVKQVRSQCKDVGDLAITLDCASITQLPRIDRILEKSRYIVEIDHHIYRNQFGDIQLISENASSVGEIVLKLLNCLRIKIDKRIAECLLTSAIVETCSFSGESVSSDTFETCAKLIQTGVDFNKISQRYYWKKNLPAMHLTGLAYLRVKIVKNSNVVWSIIYKEDFKKFNGKQEDVDPVADDILVTGEAKISLFFREIENNMMRVSLRSKGIIDVGRLATTYGGGGHQNVSSCRIHNTKRAIEKLIKKAAQLT
ncbi:MAG: DHH family phosphoesterase [Candidatus Omnitrophica bacterium]|nr:DHH family phosphoesterase [Candidatus Omnitrophota bacterium]